MSSLATLQMLGLDDVVWPVTYRFVAQGGRNWTSWEMTVDAFGLNGMRDESIALGPRLFDSTIATAICTSVDLVYFDYLIHKLAPAPSIGGGGFHRGHIFSTPAPRDKTACLTFNTGHGDTFGRRRHYLYGMPINWQDGALLTNRGWDGCMAYAHMLSMGMSGQFIGGDLQHLIAYWNVVPQTPTNFWGIGFRRVTSYNVFQYVEKAPELSTELWPPTGS